MSKNCELNQCKCEVHDLQLRVRCWVTKAFGIDSLRDHLERARRVVEEAELGQVMGLSRSSAHQLVDYVFDRPVGEVKQEIGGLIVTTFAAAESVGVDAILCCEAEIDRIEQPEVIVRCQEKQAKKRDSGV